MFISHSDLQTILRSNKNTPNFVLNAVFAKLPITTLVKKDNVNQLIQESTSRLRAMFGESSVMVMSFGRDYAVRRSTITLSLRPTTDGYVISAVNANENIDVEDCFNAATIMTFKHTDVSPSSITEFKNLLASSHFVETDDTYALSF